MEKIGVPLKELAKTVWQFRHDKRVEAREMMRDDEEKELLRRRDTAKYGTPDGSAFEFLVEHLKANRLEKNADLKPSSKVRIALTQALIRCLVFEYKRIIL